MPCYFTHYWRNSTIEAHRREGLEGKPCIAVFGNSFSALGVAPGDYLYEIGVVDGALYLICRLRVSTVRPRTPQAKLSPGEVRDGAAQAAEWGEEVVAAESTPRRFDSEVPLTVTERIECLAHGAARGLTFSSPGNLDQQTLRITRELTGRSAALLDQFWWPTRRSTRHLSRRAS
jgi:hypothetical protein